MSGNDLIYVSPQLYLTSGANWKLSYDELNSNSDYTDYSRHVLILKSDLPKFLENLNAKRTKDSNLLSKEEHSDRTRDSREGVRNETNADKGDIGVGKSTTLYLPLKEFLPRTSKERFFTVSITNVSSKLPSYFIESFLNYISVRKIKNWTNSLTVDGQNIFVKFDEISNQELSGILIFWDKLFKELPQSIPSFQWELHYDSNIKKLLQDNSKDDEKSTVDLLELKDVLAHYSDLFSTFKAKKLVSQDRPESSDDWSDEYRIDLQLLSDIPGTELDQLCKDIMRFRTKVFIDEKNKRMKQNVEDNRLNKQKMMKIVEQIKKTKNLPQNEIAEDISEEEDSEEEEDDDNVTDEAILRRELDLIEKENNKRYLTLLASLKQKIEPNLNELQQKITESSNYSYSLVKNRELFKKEITYLIKDPYYNYDYNRTVRVKEVEHDEINRQQYPDAKLDIMNTLSVPVSLSENTATPHELVHTTDNLTNQKQLPEKNKADEKDKGTKNKIKINLALKTKIDKYDDKLIDAPVTTSTTEIDNASASASETESDEEIKKIREINNTLPFDENEMNKKINELRASKLIDELVKEYLGVYENELVEYILDNISIHKNKTLLLEDLKETFDNDAITIVETIWSNEILKQ